MNRKTKVVLAVLVVLVAGGVAAYGLLGGDDSDSGSAKGQGQQSGKSKQKDGASNSGSGADGTEAQEDSDAEQIRAAVSGKYETSETSVTNVEVNGNSATATLENGTVVPLRFEGGRWVPQVDAPEVSQPDTPEVPEPSAPQVETPQVQTPSAPAMPSAP